ncbi:MAG: glutamine-hydrolyzing carbamoyl-phosphate synthase small subunit [Geodermatophilaceae bacterium]|nr:glutamine-hydrolyzing carbamoyl-phosphate synthase small subunit [Geodermatophilaceae bacterium]
MTTAPAWRSDGLRQNRHEGAALLVLEDGRAFRGESFGAIGQTLGEAVFNTGMTGYQETLTDPSYAGQVVVMTAPQIGNTGMNDEDGESDGIQVAGFVVRDPSPRPSSWRSRRSLESALVDAGVVGISGIDTRALTRHLRERGAMRVGISSVTADVEEVLAAVQAAPQMAGADLAPGVSTKHRYVVAALGSPRFRVAALDLGIKTMTPHRMAQRGIEVQVHPARTTAEGLLADFPDGVFISNGPGDPATADYAVQAVRGVLDAGVPLFGICFGNQILGRALGLSTYKLRYGHHGINLPVLDRATGKVEVTAHNHGFAIQAREGSGAGEPFAAGYRPEPFDTPYGPAEISHVCLNDGVAEGLTCLETPAFSVQYHPEAAAGPHDADYLFDRFVKLLSAAKGQRGHA